MTEDTKTGNAFLLRPVVLGLGDFLLLNVAFWTVNLWKGGSWNLSDRNGRLLAAFWGIWLVVSLCARKFRLKKWNGYWQGVRVILRAGIYLAYCMAVWVVLLGVYALSRGQVFGTCLVLTGLEWALFSLLYLIFLQKRIIFQGRGREIPAHSSGDISVPLLLIDLGMVALSFLIINYFKRGGFYFLPDYEKLLLLIYGVWLICAGITRKFEQKIYSNFYHAMWPWIKAGVLMFLSLALIVFLFRFTYFSRTQVFGSVILLVLLELMLCALYFSVKQKKRQEEDIESLEERQEILRQEILPVQMDVNEIRTRMMTPVREGLRNRVLKDNRELFEFLDQNLDLSSIIRAEMVLRDSSSLLNWDVLDGGQPVRLIINIHKLNDIRWVNRYFLEAYNMLLSGGWLIAAAHTVQTHREWMFKKYPRILAQILYSLDFAVHRACPKIPWIKAVYFSITKGRDRRLSRSEVLGRLCFCGFDIVAEKEINNRLYVVASKQLSPSINTHPSYGPFVKLKRIGNNGKALSIYKFRTMHPYSEFLQDYIYRLHGLQEGGKLDNDFRLTGWGRVMRRFWIDELPMLVNWIRGDLQFFGVRPLSSQYFSLYPKDLQDLRIKVKPGLVPPFYADLPDTFEEICESERRYIEGYLKRPVSTQMAYFGKAMWNILVKGERSR